MESWLVNGQPDGIVAAGDRGLAYGDGLFETIAVRQGAPRFFDRHMSRLQEGCRRLALPDPAAGTIADEIARLAASRARGTAKVIVTRGVGPRGYRPPTTATPTRIIGFMPDEGEKLTAMAAGIRIVDCRTPAATNPALAGLKTLNRLDNVLARSEWQDEDVSEGLMSDADGRLVGGTMSNLFVVSDGRLLTPDIRHGGIRGIMRGVVLEAAARTGVAVSETDLGAAHLARADELFVTNALIGIWPVIWHAGRSRGIGPVTRAIAAALASAGVEECRA